jgi:hypothetical protein
VTTGAQTVAVYKDASAPAFVAVTNITGVPTTATAGTALTLTGTVAPPNATNKTIAWSVQNAGTTGATITGNTLNTTAAGTVTMTATVKDGLEGSEIAAIAAGYMHTIALKEDGSLWAWGNNNNGQLGDGTKTNKLEAVYIMDDVAQVSAGEYYTMAIKNDGSLWAWGSNDAGQLGDGTVTIFVPYRSRFEDHDKSTPVRIMDNVAQVSAGVYHTMAVKSDGSIWAWGQNIWGQLGDGTTTDKLTPVKIMDGGATGQATTETPSQPPKTPRIGEPIGDVVYTSITAYIDGQPIPISNINGYAQIIVEDLAGYGFDVAWNAAEKTLRVERNKGKATKPLPIESIPPGKKPGDLKAKYVVSAIKVYLSGELVESYSINGYMFIDFNLLGKYGKVTWDNSARRLSCQLY